MKYSCSRLTSSVDSTPCPARLASMTSADKHVVHRLLRAKHKGAVTYKVHTHQHGLPLSSFRCKSPHDVGTSHGNVPTGLLWSPIGCVPVCGQPKVGCHD